MWDLLLLLGLISSAICQVVVKLPDGEIKGAEYKTYGGKAYLAFRGIPFAEPPVGKLRFEPPQPPKKWSGVLNLPKSTNICYQMSSNSAQENEDCLYIQVYTPVLNAASNNTKLPVMFSIHGGGFRNGAAGTAANYWVQNDVILVQAEYRLGAFGFLSTGNTVLPGNAGLKDQLLALEWTHNNIHLFGGDNTKITLQGQSAGSASVGFLVLSPRAKGLFRAAIGESGSPLNTWTYSEKPLTYVVELAEAIHSSISKNLTPAQYVAYLQTVPAKSIDSAQYELSAKQAMPKVAIEPNHSGAYITQSMYEIFENGGYNRVPMILGINSEESISTIDNMSTVESTAKHKDEYPMYCLPDDYKLKNGINATLAGKYIHDIYAGKNGQMATHLGRFVKWSSDNWITRGVIKQGQLMSKYSPVYFYQFSYKGPAGGFNKTLPEADTVTHGEELAYFSKNVNTMTKADALTHDRMLTLWSTFIKELNPTPHKLTLLENIIWSKVTPSNYEYLNINHTLALERQPKGTYFLGWENLFNAYMHTPFITY